MKTLTSTLAGLLLAGLTASAHAQPPRIANGPLPRQPSYDPVNCNNPPKGAVTRISGPAAPYALVYCAPNGHTIAPPDGYVWFPIDQPGQLFLFAAATNKPNDTGRSWFASQKSSYVTRDHLKQVNDELNKGYKIDHSFDDVVELDTAAADGQKFNIFFFISQNRPKYVLGCVDGCKTSVLLREYSFEEAKKATAQ